MTSDTLALTSPRARRRRLLRKRFMRRPVAVGSLIVMIITGSLLFFSESVKCYYSNPFWIKMGALSLAIMFTFTARRMIVAADETRLGPVWGRLAAVTSIVLWGTVAWGGRWIGFSG